MRRENQNDVTGTIETLCGRHPPLLRITSNLEEITDNEQMICKGMRAEVKLRETARDKVQKQQQNLDRVMIKDAGNRTKITQVLSWEVRVVRMDVFSG